MASDAGALSRAASRVRFLINTTKSEACERARAAKATASDVRAPTRSCGALLHRQHDVGQLAPGRQANESFRNKKGKETGEKGELKKIGRFAVHTKRKADILIDVLNSFGFYCF